MAIYHTQTASISAGATLLTGLVIDASITTSHEHVDVTSTSSTFRAFSPGITSGSASGTIWYDQANAGVSALEQAAVTGANVAMIYTNGTGQTVTVSCVVRDFTPTWSVNDMVRATFSLAFNGAPVVA